MHIKTIYIDSFGPLSQRTITLSPGLNVIEGPNESGKSAVASFIKFIFYGLSGRGTGGAMSERRRNVSWKDGRAAGYIILETAEGNFRVERELSVSFSDTGSRRESARESVRILSLPNMEQVHKDKSPGEVFFGVPEGVFLNTAFVRQMSGARVDGGELGDAIENIMFSADEAVSAERAVERIEKSRRELQHKKGEGGMVSVLAARRDELKEKMEADRANIQEIIALEASLADCRRSMEEKRIQRDSLSGVLRAYDDLSEYKKLADLENTKAQALHLKNQLEELRASPASYEYTARMRELSEIMSRCTETSGELYQRRISIEAELSDIENASFEKNISPEDAELDGRKLKKGASAGLSFGIIFAAIGVLGAALLFVLRLFETVYFLPVAAVCLIFFVAGIITMASALSKRKALAVLLEKCGADSVEEIADCVRKRIAQADRVHQLETELGYIEMSAGENDASLAEAREEIISTAVALDISPENVPDEFHTENEPENPVMRCALYAVKISDGICAQRDRTLKDYSTVSGRLSVLEEHFEGRDKNAVITAGKDAEASADGAAALALDPDGAAESRRKRDFFAESLNALRSRESNIETKLAALKAVTGNAAEDEEKLSRLNSEIDALSIRHDALCLARDTIIKAGESLRRGVLPQIVRIAADNLQVLSHGRYGDIGVSQDFGVSFSDSAVSRSAEYLSEGTKELVYLSLRRALMQVMYGEKNPPAVYDESFAGLDEDRLCAMLSLLCGGGQSLLFTCRALEAEIAGALPGVTVHKMERA